jgi:hypothetical protein
MINAANGTDGPSGVLDPDNAVAAPISRPELPMTTRRIRSPSGRARFTAKRGKPA